MVLVCGALAAVHFVLHVITVPVLASLAVTFPPVYGVVAGIHSLMPFLARRMTQVPGTAVLTSAIASVFVASTNPSGIIVVVPVVLAGAVIDAVLWRSPHPGEGRFALASVIAGLVLFVVSLAVFSPEHLTPFMLVGALVGRVAGELAANGAARALSSALFRAGIRRPGPGDT